MGHHGLQRIALHPCDEGQSRKAMAGTHYSQIS